jgi:hypothetical protein
MTPTTAEQIRRDEVIAQILTDIKSNTTIFLPDFDPKISRPSDEYALLSVGIEPNPYGGTIDSYRYQFEGEEDLLHLIIVRTDGETKPAPSPTTSTSATMFSSNFLWTLLPRRGGIEGKALLSKPVP